MESGDLEGEAQREEAMRALGRGDEQPRQLIGAGLRRRAAVMTGRGEGPVLRDSALPSTHDLALNRPEQRADARVRKALGRVRRHGWQTLSAIPVGNLGRAIDHLAIGPGGVFAITAQELRDQVVTVAPNELRIGDTAWDPMSPARWEALEANTLLGRALGAELALVQPLLVLIDAQMAVAGQPRGLGVTTLPSLPGFLRRLEPGLDRPEIERLYQAARDRNTWQSSDAQATLARLHQR